MRSLLWLLVLTAVAANEEAVVDQETAAPVQAVYPAPAPYPLHPGLQPRHVGAGAGFNFGPIGAGFGGGLGANGINFGAGAGFDQKYQYYGTPTVYQQYYRPSYQSYPSYTTYSPVAAAARHVGGGAGFNFGPIGAGFGGGLGANGLNFGGGLGFGQQYQYAGTPNVYKQYYASPYQPQYVAPVYPQWTTVASEAAARNLGGGLGLQLGPVGLGFGAGLGPSGFQVGGGAGFSNQYQYYGTPTVYRKYYTARPTYNYGY